MLELDKSFYSFIVGSGGHYELDPLNPWFNTDFFTIVPSKNCNIFLKAGNKINHDSEIYRVIASMNNADFTKTFWATVVKDEDYKKRIKEWETKPSETR